MVEKKPDIGSIDPNLVQGAPDPTDAPPADAAPAVAPAPATGNASAGVVDPALVRDVLGGVSSSSADSSGGSGAGVVDPQLVHDILTSHASGDSGAPKPAAPSHPFIRAARKAGFTPPTRAQPTPQPPKELSLGEAFQQGVQNFVPSFKGQIKGMVEPLLPQNWGNDVRTAWNLGKGVAAKTGFIDDKDPAQKAKDTAIVDAVGHYYGQKYGTMSGFKQALASDPASFLSDAAAVGSIAGGGEGLVAKLPGALGDAAAAGARTAGAVGNALNPIGLAARGVSAVLPKASAFTRAGRLSGPVRAAMGDAFSSGTLDPEHLEAYFQSNPDAAAKFNAVIRQKGVSPASVREGVVSHFYDDNAPISQQTVTGQAAPTSVTGAVQEASREGRHGVAQAAQGLAGDADATDFGTHLENSMIGARDDSVAKFRGIETEPGKFDPTFADDFQSSIDDALAENKIQPVDLLQHRANYPGTNEALAYLNAAIPRLASQDALTPANLLGVRQDLTGQLLSKAANDTDRRGIMTLTDALENHMVEAAKNGLYQGGDGPAVANNLANAVDSWRNYRKRFFDRAVHPDLTSSANTISAAQGTDDVTGLTTPAAEGVTGQVQTNLMAKLMSPSSLATKPGAERLFSKLTDAMGGPDSDGAQALRNSVRQSVLRTKPGPNGIDVLAQSPDQIQAFLNSPLADQTFTPEEQAQVRMMAESERMLAASPNRAAQQESMLKGIVSSGWRPAAAALVGHAIHPGAGEITGMMMERGLEPTLNAAKAAKWTQGAPVVGNPLFKAGRTAANVAENAPKTPVFMGEFGGMQDTAQPTPQDQQQQQAPAPVPAGAPDADPVFSRMLKQESGNHQTRKDGSPVVSKAGAIGAAQVMPGTGPQAAALAGEAWDPQRLRTDADYNKRLGYAYYQSLLQQFGGDPQKAVAAYNAGPAGVMRAIKRASTTGKEWTAHLPEETKGYLHNILGTQMAANGGRIERASGGRTMDHEALVQRLMTAAERAKKAETDSTKPLLHAPDDAIVHALSIAKAAI